MSNHNTYIKEEIAKAMKRRVRVQSLPMPSNPIPPAERSKFLTNFLMSCILLVSVITIFALVSKFDWSVLRPSVIVQKSIEEPVGSTNNGDSEKLSSLDTRISDIESDLKTWNKRVWLLGIAHNENSTMSSYINKKYHPNDPSDFISFERDWKLNRMPRSLNLESTDKEMMQEHVK